MPFTIDLRTGVILLPLTVNVFLSWGESIANWYPETEQVFGKEGMSSRKVFAFAKRALVIFIFSVRGACEKTQQLRNAKMIIYKNFIVYLTDLCRTNYFPLVLRLYLLYMMQKADL